MCGGSAGLTHYRWDSPDSRGSVIPRRFPAAEDVSLRPGDEVRIVVGALTLENTVASPELGARLSGWSFPYEGQRHRTIR
jgi:hypothetical protein